VVDHNEILKENSVLESNRLILRPFTIDDIDDVLLYASDNIVTKYLTWPSYMDISQVEEVVKKYYIGKEGIFAIELESEQKCIGCIGLSVYIEHNKASFGYVLNREYWNKGYMTEALNIILDFSFLKLELNRVEATHYIGNEGSGRVMQKCGMKYEGTGIQELKVKDIYQDVAHYAILRNEWLIR
jgi:ribosomal-protein-alanine N-acetyltransferase